MLPECIWKMLKILSGVIPLCLVNGQMVWSGRYARGLIVGITNSRMVKDEILKGSTAPPTFFDYHFWHVSNCSVTPI